MSPVPFYFVKCGCWDICLDRHDPGSISARDQGLGGGEGGARLMLRKTRVSVPAAVGAQRAAARVCLVKVQQISGICSRL